jgi:ADP-heptose:LPS heptosyltransferase
MEHLAEAIDAHDAGGPLRVYPDSARMEAWRARLPALGERDGRLWIAVHISAREPERRWPIWRWVDLIGRLTATGNTGVVLLWAPGSADDPRHPGDDADAGAILKQAGASVLPAPTAELADLIAALALCDAFIGADGGAVHLAAALGLPTVALFENLESKKRHWYPWQVPYELVAPATRDIADITVEQVVEGWQRLAPRVASRGAAAAI